MEGAYAPQGLDIEDRVALGLGATHLFYLVVFSMAGWGILTSHLPPWLRLPVGCVVLLAGVTLAWGNIAGRPLDRWLLLYARFRLRSRISAHAAAEPAPAKVLAPTSRARRVAFYSHSGGVGKTTLAFETACMLASDPGCRVVVLEMEAASGALRLRSGLDGPTLDHLRGEAEPDPATLDRVILAHPSGASVVLGLGASTSAEEIAPLVATLLGSLDDCGYTHVVLDVPTAAVDSQPLLAASLLPLLDAVYCVFTPTAAGFFGVYGAVAALRRHGLREQVRLVLNRSNPGVELAEITGDLRVAVVSSIPELTELGRAEATHVAACLVDSAVAGALYPLAADARTCSTSARTPGASSPIGERLNMRANSLRGVTASSP